MAWECLDGASKPLLRFVDILRLAMPLGEREAKGSVEDLRRMQAGRLHALAKIGVDHLFVNVNRPAFQRIE